MVPGLDEIERLNSLLETLRRHGVASFTSGDLRIELGFSPVEADKLLDGANGSTPEDLIAQALKGARR